MIEKHIKYTWTGLSEDELRLIEHSVREYRVDNIRFQEAKQSILAQVRASFTQETA